MSMSVSQAQPLEPAGPLTRTVLREQVKELLLERILSGRYQPGERLVETRIAQELGVSQAPVREALRDLEILRFVESAAFRGARVREVSREEMAQVYPVRAALEGLAAQEAARRMNGDVRALERELRAMRAAGDLHELVDHDVRFHELIVEAAGNAPLCDVWRSLQVAARSAVTVLATGLDIREIADMHKPILEALRRRDGGLAAREIEAHLNHFATLMLSTPEADTGQRVSNDGRASGRRPKASAAAKPPKSGLTP
jgi:DNA-binding GntR family transcriptional regulator